MSEAMDDGQFTLLLRDLYRTHRSEIDTLTAALSPMARDGAKQIEVILLSEKDESLKRKEIHRLKKAYPPEVRLELNKNREDIVTLLTESLSQKQKAGTDL